MPKYCHSFPSSFVDTFQQFFKRLSITTEAIGGWTMFKIASINSLFPQIGRPSTTKWITVGPNSIMYITHKIAESFLQKSIHTSKLCDCSWLQVLSNKHSALLGLSSVFHYSCFWRFLPTSWMITVMKPRRGSIYDRTGNFDEPRFTCFPLRDKEHEEMTILFTGIINLTIPILMTAIDNIMVTKKLLCL